MSYMEKTIKIPYRDISKTVYPGHTYTIHSMSYVHKNENNVHKDQGSSKITRV